MKTSKTYIESPGQQNLPAGCFSSWLRRTRHSLIKGTGIEVNCGDCRGCCTSSYFIHIKPEETETIKHIDRKLLFPAPGLPKGNMLLGYDKKGQCPMLRDNKCSMYKFRSETCRIYDCRIFAAAGIAAGGEDKVLINQQVMRWKFSYPTNKDLELHDAVKSAAKFILEHPDSFPGGKSPTNPSQVAVLAIKVYKVFMNSNNKIENVERRKTNKEIAEEIIKANEEFEAMREKI